MTPTHRATLRALGRSQEWFAAVTGEHPVTVSYWGRDRNDSRRGVVNQDTPPWVGLLLDAWLACPGVIPPKS